VRIPIQLGPASNWTLSDFGRKWQNSPAAAGGRTIARMATVPQDELWLIDILRVSVSPAATSQAARAYLCMDTPDFDVMGTSTGVYDVADQNSPVHAPGGSEILVVWTDVPNGAIGRAYQQWQVMRHGSGIMEGH
jgi:hypothetical protein